MFDRLFNQHILYSAFKQASFLQRFGKQEWNFDTKQGHLTFGRKTTFQAEILGSYSADSGTWLWGWANDASGLPESVTRISRGMRKFGSEKGLEPFTTPQFPVTQQMNHETLGLLVIGLARMPCFYNATHEHGSVLLVVTTPEANPLPAVSNINFINHVSSVISQVPITSHRDAVIGFCAALKWQGEDRGGSVIIRNPAEQAAVEVTFDAQQRITGLNTKVSGKAT